MQILHASTGDEIPVLITGETTASSVIVLAHGAGAPMDTEFMAYFAETLSNTDIAIIRFEFPYMAKRRVDGKRRPPDRQPKLFDAFSSVLKYVHDTHGEKSLFIGGKSMGGRMATIFPTEQTAASPISGIFALGYPFHPPGKPEKLRTGHFSEVLLPTLICQGERDTFGNREEVSNYDLPTNIDFFWAPDGNHDLAPRKSSGYSKVGNWHSAADALTKFVVNISAQKSIS